MKLRQKQAAQLQPLPPSKHFLSRRAVRLRDDVIKAMANGDAHEVRRKYVDLCYAREQDLLVALTTLGVLGKPFYNNCKTADACLEYLQAKEPQNIKALTKITKCNKTLMRIHYGVLTGAGYWDAAPDLRDTMMNAGAVRLALR